MTLKIKTYLIYIAALFLSGCANHLQLGVDAYNKGNYDIAAKHWNPLAKQGNPYAEYNIGLLWENGLGSTNKNINEASQWYARSAQRGYVPAMVRLALIQKNNGLEEPALSWFNLAARWGNSEAISNLRSWGKPVPQPDLLAAQNKRNAIAQQQAAMALSNAAYNIGCALGGGSCSGSQTSYPTPSYSNSYNSTKNNSVYTDKQCTSDFSCGIGHTCVKAPLKSTGICMKSVNQYGTRQYNTPNTDSIGVNLNLDGQCSFNTDCPVGFRCDSKLKACVK